jgi:2,4-dienoyl-CoA reductase-like NADH-dependent reductase (Old Yellow Enzyme family)
MSTSSTTLSALSRSFSSSPILPWSVTRSPALQLRSPPSGVVLPSNSPLPLLFTPLQIRSLTLRNRLAVSPMCQYSSTDGYLNNYHLTHLGQFALHGAGLIIQEATSVNPQGRITPFCTGLWKDEHEAMASEIVKFVHSQGSAIGIQLGHAGRKASTFPPFIQSTKETKTEGIRRQYCNQEELGWPEQVVAPSPIPFGPGWLTPRELTTAEIHDLVVQFRSTAERAFRCNYDVIEIHAAHGYLISSFLSPLSNQRTDDYGGSLENRARFLIEILHSVRSVWPKERPLFVRISCEEWVEGGWNSQDSVQLAALLIDPDLGVDLIDCSTGGMNQNQKIPVSPGFQVKFSEAIKNAHGNHIKTGAVGLITDGKQAEEILQRGKADLIFVARAFLSNPTLAITAANELGVQLTLAPQYLRSRV